MVMKIACVNPDQRHIPTKTKTFHTYNKTFHKQFVYVNLSQVLSVNIFSSKVQLHSHFSISPSVISVMGTLQNKPLPPFLFYFYLFF